MNSEFLTLNGLERFFEPIEINGMRLQNRFIMPGMQRGWAEAGAPTPQMAAYYRRRLEGGVSLIISESCAVAHPNATAQPLACKLDKTTASAWESTITPVREAGGNFLLQLWHEGAFRNDSDGRTISASALAHPDLRQGRAASRQDLEEIVEAFALSARLAQNVGASGVELHCAHGFFLDQFLWVKTNLRNDEYGGARLVDRATLHAQILRAIRQACGDDFVISVRFSQWKEHDYGARIAQTPEELAEFLVLLESAGADMFHASARRFWLPEWDHDERSIAGWTKHLSTKPTAAVGSAGLDRDVMQSFSEEGEASGTMPETVRHMRDGMTSGQFDLLSVGRSLIGDPDWVKKLQSGDIAAIRPFRKSDISEFEWET